jgi:hypothetical protein
MLRRGRKAKEGSVVREEREVKEGRLRKEG